jgi:hypothetical protein
LQVYLCKNEVDTPSDQTGMHQGGTFFYPISLSCFDIIQDRRNGDGSSQFWQFLAGISLLLAVIFKYKEVS